MNSISIERLVERADLLLVWLGMANKGVNPICPEKDTWQYDELRERCIDLRNYIDIVRHET